MVAVYRGIIQVISTRACNVGLDQGIRACKSETLDYLRIFEPHLNFQSNFMWWRRCFCWVTYNLFVLRKRIMLLLKFLHSHILISFKCTSYVWRIQKAVMRNQGIKVATHVMHSDIIVPSYIFQIKKKSSRMKRQWWCWSTRIRISVTSLWSTNLYNLWIDPALEAASNATLVISHVSWFVAFGHSMGMATLIM